MQHSQRGDPLCVIIMRHTYNARVDLPNHVTMIPKNVFGQISRHDKIIKIGSAVCARSKYFVLHNKCDDN